MASRPVALPPRFKCSVGGEWKANSEFSQNQLKRWTQKKRHENDGITSINIGLVCKVHSGAPPDPIVRCQGPCGQKKAREAFSKNQRNKPDAVSADLSHGETYSDIARVAPSHDTSHDTWDLQDVEADDDDDDAHINDHDGHSISDVGDDEDADPSVVKSITRSILRTSRPNDFGDSDDVVDYGDDDSDNDDDDVIKVYEVGNSIIGQLPRPPSAGSVASTKASFGGTEVPSIAEESKTTRPSYARATGIASTSSVTSGDSRSVRRAIPPLRGHFLGQSTVASGDNQGVNRAIPPLRGHFYGQSTVAPTTMTTTSIHYRPQLRGMSGQDHSPTTLPHFRGTQQAVPSTDSRADLESLVSSTVASAAQPSNVQSYDAYAPRGDRPRQVTAEIPDNSGDRKKPRVGPSGWLKLDQRKRFDAPPTFMANVEDPYPEPAYESGSEDEM
ncbi:hypothetical protein SLS62_002182 [Diatrype stigma]|uniref:Stc1 domain-containing protein n=1 Tax=Diatrype stigma TaxID=117547 RepID=A0AAN9UV07_9PEZI